eukprot:TRINITY_DN3356_c0_g2_i8.p1 TRINITY_DN3356_c0_g2~~TRINITY_DN3356_c0_g2_i8.p1  ORF type:complete len:329 (-),score=74.18 TRINITY_DN3356_c0_g2_i8:193-1179(-)
MAPEVKMGNYGPSSDIYSLGLVFYELFERKLPSYDSRTQVAVLPERFMSAPVIFPCIKSMPQQRPVIDQVLVALDKLIRSAVAVAQNQLTPEVQTICRNEAQKRVSESAAQGTSITYSEAESASFFQYLLSLPQTEADVLCGIKEKSPQPQPLAQPQAQSSPQQVYVQSPQQPFEDYQPIKLNVVNAAPRERKNVKPNLSSSSSSLRHVTVNIRSGRNLKAADFNGTSDPYCNLWINGVHSKTKIIHKTLNPEWDHVLSIPLTTSIGRVRLQLEVWDWNHASHEFLGFLDTPINVSSSSHEWYQLRPRSRSDKNITGEVLVEVAIQQN